MKKKNPSLLVNSGSDDKCSWFLVGKEKKRSKTDKAGESDGVQKVGGREQISVCIACWRLSWCLFHMINLHLLLCVITDISDYSDVQFTLSLMFPPHALSSSYKCLGISM